MDDITNMHLYVKGIMSEHVIKCKNSDSMAKVSKILLEHDINSIFVNDGRKDVGIITLNNIISCLLKKDPKPGSVKAKDIMSFPIIYVYEDDELVTAIEKLNRYDISRLIVRNKRNQDVGIITDTDLIKKICIMSIDYKNHEYAQDSKNTADFKISSITKQLKRVGIKESMKKVLRNLDDVSKNVVIISNGKKDVGIISKKDILAKICVNDKLYSEVNIAAVVRKKFVTIEEGTSYLEALLLFLVKKIETAIVKKDGKIIGSISFNDFVKRSHENYKRANKVLKEGGFAKSVLMQVDNPAIDQGIILTKIYQA
jgi:predicted transcriptional regulator